jgi:hypothetical protein
MALRKIGFLSIGRFDQANPGPGHEESLRMIERAEALGFDSIWVVFTDGDHAAGPVAVWPQYSPPFTHTSS